MHRNSVRISRLEDGIRRRREWLRDRLIAVCQQELSEDVYYGLADALERNIADGDRAEYTPAENEAIAAFDAMLARRPDIAAVVIELNASEPDDN